MEVKIQENAISVFISYSHDSSEHSNKVLSLADRLRRDGLDCLLDQYEIAPNEGWPVWMTKCIRKADYVLLICTERYHHLSSGEEVYAKGKGVKYETLLTYQNICENNSRNDRFIPVVFHQNDSGFIPEPLRSFQHYAIETDAGYEDLYRRLTKQPRISKPERGIVRGLPTGLNIDTAKINNEETNMNMPISETNISKENTNRHANLIKNEIELVINRDFGSYTTEDQRHFLQALGELLSTKDDIKITKLRPGSVIMSIELTLEQTVEIFELLHGGVLETLGVVDVVFPSQENVSTAKKLTTSHTPVPYRNKIGTAREGTVKWYDKKKGYGFILGDTGGDIFVHYTSFADSTIPSLDEGERVTFDIVNDQRGLKAENVVSSRTIKNDKK
jgi:cold shock CspA family protein